jgi:hypothetical protein
MLVVSMSKQEFSRLDVLMRVQSGHLALRPRCAPTPTPTLRKSGETSCQAGLRRFCLLHDPRWLPGQRRDGYLCAVSARDRVPTWCCPLAPAGDPPLAATTVESLILGTLKPQ